MFDIVGTSVIPVLITPAAAALLCCMSSGASWVLHVTVQACSAAASRCCCVSCAWHGTEFTSRVVRRQKRLLAPMCVYLY